MSFTVEIEDEDSSISYSYSGTHFTVGRPTNGMTPLIKEVIDSIIARDSRVEEFLLQTDYVDVIVGKERCG